MSTQSTDFGESRRREFDGDMTTVGTADFCAPEMVSGEKYDEKVDVYSFGIILGEMVLHSKPYHGIPRNGLQIKIIEGLRPAIPSSFQEEWPQIFKLMTRCWDRDPKKRPAMREAANVLFDAVPKSRKLRGGLSGKSFDDLPVEERASNLPAKSLDADRRKTSITTFHSDALVNHIEVHNLASLKGAAQVGKSQHPTGEMTAMEQLAQIVCDECGTSSKVKWQCQDCRPSA